MNNNTYLAGTWIDENEEFLKINYRAEVQFLKNENSLPFQRGIVENSTISILVTTRTPLRNTVKTSEFKIRKESDDKIILYNYNERIKCWVIKERYTKISHPSILAKTSTIFQQLAMDFVNVFITIFSKIPKNFYFLIVGLGLVVYNSIPLLYHLFIKTKKIYSAGYYDEEDDYYYTYIDAFTYSVYFFSALILIYILVEYNRISKHLK